MKHSYRKRYGHLNYFPDQITFTHFYRYHKQLATLAKALFHVYQTNNCMTVIFATVLYDVFGVRKSIMAMHYQRRSTFVRHLTFN